MIEAQIHVGAIYKHYKGSFYRVIDVAYHHETKEAIVIYNKCDEKGLFISIREGAKIVSQPFYRKLSEFVENVQGGYPNNPAIPRFAFFKQL